MRGCVSIPAFRFLPILVFVCDHSFMLFRKCTLNSSISLCHSSFYVFHTFSFRRNRVMNGQNHAMAMYPFACTWQDFKRTVDCNGNNCQLQVICQLKRPFFEISNVSCTFTCFSYKWYLTQAFFHHPLEISSDESINKKNIEGSLMIRHKDIRGLPV